MRNILSIAGARPQFIKAAAFSRAIRDHFANDLKEVLLHTGQHYDDNMSDVFFRELELSEPDINLGVGSGSHGLQTALMLKDIEEAILNNSPDLIVVYGDTNSTLAAALAASKLRVPLAHIEAGLRSFNKNMPEEINRIVCDHCSTLLFTPTKAGLNNLIREGFSPDAQPPYSTDNPLVTHCGDIMYDNALYFSKISEKNTLILKKHHLKKGEYILATIHRDHNTDNEEVLKGIFNAFRFIAREEGIPVIIPLHPRTANVVINCRIPGDDGLIFIEPLSYLEMLMFESNAQMIFTDSGGVQKEACYHRKKCLVIRNETEWVELAAHGMLEIAGVTGDSIIKHYHILKERQLADFPAPYGDGKAAEFICSKIRDFLS